MKNFGGAFLEAVVAGVKGGECTAGREKMSAGEGLTAFYEAVAACAARSGKVIYVGNGGSASIAGHMAADLWKNGGIKTLCFNEPALLTCLANDLGYENVFSAPAASYADKGDVFVAISSSGKSPNILKACAAALRNGAVLVTFSGFAPDNPLRSLGKLNFYVPSAVYGVVETAHSAFCHAVVDRVTRERRPRRRQAGPK